jgi:hypothetical protein
VVITQDIQIYRILILSHKYISSFPAAVKQSVWAAVRVDYVDSVNEPTKVTKRYLLDKIMRQ